MIPNSGYRLSDKIVLKQFAQRFRNCGASGQAARMLIHSTAQDNGA
jgi:hypothetical protein